MSQMRRRKGDRERKLQQNVLFNRCNKRCVVALLHYANVTEWQQINEDGHNSLFAWTEKCNIAMRKPNHSAMEIRCQECQKKEKNNSSSNNISQKYLNTYS